MGDGGSTQCAPRVTQGGECQNNGPPTPSRLTKDSNIYYSSYVLAYDRDWKAGGKKGRNIIIIILSEARAVPAIGTLSRAAVTSSTVLSQNTVLFLRILRGRNGKLTRGMCMYSRGAINFNGIITLRGEIKG